MKRVLTLAVVVWAVSTDRAAADEPKHLAEARKLVAAINLKDTSYAHGEPDVRFAAPTHSHADCSGFVDALLKHSYGYDAAAFKTWFGSKRPTAARYYDAVVGKNGFAPVARVKDALPGDFLAVKYLARTDNTGHIMLVAGDPTPLRPTAPVVPGTEQWEVKVIDSSMSGHGSKDTRHKAGTNGKDHTGLGEGVLRIYADPKGHVAGFTWSTLKSSVFKDPKDEVLAIGRLRPDFKP